ncbi:MAG: dihydrodipicolinate synthase family protein [Acidobacteriota bacterium]|nr:dihydrodipicolinate synthase family protein [Acidobacteriota bacterium]
MLLEGLQLPLTTPFYPDGRLNLRKLEHNVSRYSKTPAAGLVLLSWFGEGSSLSDEETRQVLQSALAAAAPEKVMMAGVSRDSVAATLALADSAASAGYDAVLLRLPSMLQTHGVAKRKETLTYFQAVADRSALPVVLLSDGIDGKILPAEWICEMAGHPKIIGVVENGGDRERTKAMLVETAKVKHEVKVTSIFRAVTARMRMERDRPAEIISASTLSADGTGFAAPPRKNGDRTRTKVVGFQVLVGSTAGILDGLASGAVGAVPGFAASAPQACYEVLAAWKDGDRSLAEEKQVRLRDAAARVESELGVAGVKFGCDLNGYFGGRPRLPLLTLSGEERETVERLMQGLNN